MSSSFSSVRNVVCNNSWYGHTVFSLQRYAQCHKRRYQGRYQYQIFDVIGIRYRYSIKNKGHEKRERGSNLPGKTAIKISEHFYSPSVINASSFCFVLNFNFNPMASFSVLSFKFNASLVNKAHRS